MPRLSVAVITVMVLFFGSTAYAAETETKTDSKPDPRLEQKVTYEAKTKSVAKILDELSEKTGVKLTAGSNAKDWQVRDRRMNFFVKDVTLGELQKSIATLMHFRWSRGGEDGKWYYRLWQDKRSVAEQEDKLRKAEAERERKMQERRQAMVDDFTKLDSMTPDQLEKLKQENPYLYVLGKTGIAKGFGQFFSNSPGAMDSLMSGDEGRIKFSDLPPASQQGLQNAFQSVSKLMGPNGPDKSLNKLMESLPGATIEFNTMKRESAGFPVQGMLLGDMRIRSNVEGAHFELPFMDPQSNIAKNLGKALTKVMEGSSFEEVGKSMEGSMMLAVTADIAKYGATSEEKEEPQPDDPELDKKIELNCPMGTSLADALEKVNKAASVSVISDQFTQLPIIAAIDSKEIPIKEALDKITKACNSSWRKDGNIIRVQDKDWYRKRAAQIPDEWLEGWTNTLKTTGTLDIEDLANMASLTDEQINNLNWSSYPEYTELL